MHIPIKPNRHSAQASIIRAELVGDDTCEAFGIQAYSPSPIIALCRELVRRGFNPAHAVHAYRGDTVALIVRSIGEAEVVGHGHGFRRAHKWGRRPLVRVPAKNDLQIGGAP